MVMVSRSVIIVSTIVGLGRRQTQQDADAREEADTPSQEADPIRRQTRQEADPPPGGRHPLPPPNQDSDPHMGILSMHGRYWNAFLFYTKSIHLL